MSENWQSKQIISSKGIIDNEGTPRGILMGSDDSQVVQLYGSNGNPLKIEPNNSMPVTIQDQPTPIVIVPFSLLEQQTTTTGAIAIDDYVIPVASATGIAAGKMITLFDVASVRYSWFIVVSVASLNITVDRPVDFAFPSGTYVDVSETDMVKDGSGTPLVYGVRNNAGVTPPPGIDLSVDITRMIFECQTTNLPEVSMFGDIAGGLTRGLFCRKRNGEYYNVFNCKTNGEIAGIMYDWNQLDSSKHGVNGFVARLTFAGQSKMGAVQRLAINEDLEIWIQDDITSGGTVLSLKILAEGSIVEP